MRHRKNKLIAIITSWGPDLGSGHVQRMAALASFMSEFAEMRIVAPVPPDLIETAYLFTDRIPPDADLFLRDMRDSGKDEISSLKKIAPVCVIDDLGPGADMADHKFFLLPDPVTGMKNCLDPDRYFLHGYNFYRSLCEAGSACEKTIDISVYCHPADEDYYLSFTPGGASVAFLRGEESYMVLDGKRTSLKGRSPGRIILESRSLLSHFGIMMFEGKLAGCRLYCLNPTSYHSRLADMAAGYLGLENLGIRGETEIQSIRERFQREIPALPEKTVDVEEINKSVIMKLGNFRDMLMQLI